MYNINTELTLAERNAIECVFDAQVTAQAVADFKAGTYSSKPMPVSTDALKKYLATYRVEEANALDFKNRCLKIALNIGADNSPKSVQAWKAFYKAHAEWIEAWGRAFDVQVELTNRGV